jgi:hypothetical protein
MPGSLARPPRHEQRDRGVGGRLTEELEEDHGGDTIGAATVVASKRHHPMCYGDGGTAQNPWPSGQAQHRTWGDAGVADTIQPVETPPQEARVGQKPQRDRAGEDQAAGARSTEAMCGGDGDERRQDRRIAAVKWKSLGRRSKCPAWRWHSSPELAGIEQHNRRRFAIAREGNGLGLGLGRPSERE